MSKNITNANHAKLTELRVTVGFVPLVLRKFLFVQEQTLFFKNLHPNETNIKTELQRCR